MASFRQRSLAAHLFGTPPRELPKKAARALRMATARACDLPDFLIVGAQKAGTSSLYHYLSQHPQVMPAYSKEVHYFDTQYRRGESWYRASFPHRLERAMREKILKSPTVTGEATPYYLYHPHAPQRIASDLPEAKLMVLLRNPTERALSHYHHTRRRALESLSFEDALETEPERLGPELARMREDPFYNSDPHRIFSYFDRGIYVDQLQRYAEHFPRRQMLVLQSEQLFRDPQAAINRVLEFLDLDPWSLPDATPVRMAGYSRERSEVHDRLDERFRAHNQRLFDFLDEEFDW
ncbi:hypothetical protein BH20GEM2_BH20GEM2_17550 [soil metagenome]